MATLQEYVTDVEWSINAAGFDIEYEDSDCYLGNYFALSKNSEVVKTFTSLDEVLTYIEALEIEHDSS